MPASKTEWQIPVGEEYTSAIHEPAAGEAHSLFVCAHGAGGNMSDRGMLSTANALRRRGFDVVRFNFLYTERKSGRPDPMPRLEETVNAVVSHVRGQLSPRRLIIGGRSMGGRAASMLASRGYTADGLLLLAYPLHPAGQPEKLRDAHLPAITMPTICFSGTRDALCRVDLMTAVLPRLGANWRMHWVEGADHSFHVLKSTGRTDAEVMDGISAAAGSWAEEISASVPGPGGEFSRTRRS